MFKIILSIIATFVTVSVSAATYGMIKTSRGEIAPLKLSLAPYLAPGSGMPDRAWCNWREMNRFHAVSISCEAIQTDGTHVRFTYNSKSKMIVRSSFAVRGQTIGKLMLAWGTPTGYKTWGNCFEVFWGKHSAWMTGTFSPSTNVYFISFYGPEAPAVSKWAGFISLLQ
jgi:hypothetical protein